jgi:hypothetical protein
VRLTLHGGPRRADLCVPGAVPVAELLPVLVRTVGMLDPATVHAGYRLVTTDGRELDPAGCLGDQDVADGAVLTVASAAVPPPRRYDDPAEALADELAGDRAGRTPGSGREVLAVAAVLLVVLGATTASVTVVDALDAAVRAALASALALVTVAIGALPWVAVTLAGSTRSIGRLLGAAHVATGCLLVVLAPAAVGLGPAGAALALVACLVVPLHARWHTDAREARSGLLAGSLGLLAVATSVVALRPVPPAVAAAGLVGAGALGWLLRLAPPLRRRRAADVAEAVCLVAVLPLLVLATGAFAWVRDR